MSIAYVSLHTSHQTRTRHIRVQFTTGIRSHLASFAQWNPSFNMGEVLALDWSRPYRALRYSLTTLTRVSRNRNLSMLGQHFYLFEDFEYEVVTPRNSLWRFQPQQGSFDEYWTKREETQRWHGRSARVWRYLKSIWGLSSFWAFSPGSVTWKPMSWHTFDIWILKTDICSYHFAFARCSPGIPCQVSGKPRLRLKLVDVYPDCPPTFACAPRPAMNWLMQQLMSLSHPFA